VGEVVSEETNVSALSLLEESLEPLEASGCLGSCLLLRVLGQPRLKRLDYLGLHCDESLINGSQLVSAHNTHGPGSRTPPLHSPVHQSTSRLGQVAHALHDFKHPTSASVRLALPTTPACDKEPSLEGLGCLPCALQPPQCRGERGKLLHFDGTDCNAKATCALFLGLTQRRLLGLGW